MRMPTRTCRRGVLLLTATTLTLGLITVPARAAGTLCVYQHSSGRGSIQCTDANGTLSLGPRLDNQVSSVYNDLGVSMCLYDDLGHGGYALPILPHSHYANLALNTAPDGRSWNDRISSIGPTPC